MEFFPLFIDELSNSLKDPLPGKTAHKAMETLSALYLGKEPTERSRKSAVLLLLYPFVGEVYFPLILRNTYDGFHSGEIGLPGGRYEQADENLIQTALREAKEEIGLLATDVKILGTLTELYIAPSDFLVLPVLAYIPYRPDFLPDPREVQQILEAKLDYFSISEVVKRSEIQIRGDSVVTPYYELEGHKVWGATAKIISELSYILKGST